MIIGISGKAQSGKDTVAKMWQYLDNTALTYEFAPRGRPITTYEEYLDVDRRFNFSKNSSDWQIKKFADKVKEVTALITGCTVEDLENIDFKNSKLSDIWGIPDGIGIKDQIVYGEDETEIITYREALQFIGTDLFRNQFHEDTWVNTLMKDYYIGDYEYSEMWMKENPGKSPYEPQYHNWLISDVRFPNEAKAIKDKGGILIRVQREDITNQGMKVGHDSETALDHYDNWDAVIDNFGTIDELLTTVKKIKDNYEKV